MIVALLERLLAWMNRRHGCFVLTEPAILQDGSAWMRITPDGYFQWFKSEAEAMAA